MLRDATTPADFDAIVRLNLESEKFLSAMSPMRFQRLKAAASYCRVITEGGDVVAFLLAFREGADYHSENFRWFDQRYDKFLYIDRVVVAASHQGQGLGVKLYEDLLDFARRHGVPRITAEFDIEPPNETSRSFHARFGFREVGEQAVSYAAKRVSFQELTIG